MKTIIVTGGKQKEDAQSRKEWTRYEKAIILVFDFDSLTLVKKIEYVSPREATPESEYNVLFKAGDIHNNILYVCTQTEVLMYELPSFKQVGYVSHPWFNDVHHVRLSPEGNLVIANTGLDNVLIVNPKGEMIKEISALGQNTWDRFNPETDYRKILTTKPHYAHNNYTFYINNELWTTRLMQKDAINLENPDEKIKIEVEKPHDGLVVGNSVFFTTVDGHIVEADTISKMIKQVVPLKPFFKEKNAVGWCRGIAAVGENRFITGFSRLRRTPLKENLTWLRGLIDPESNPLPARIALLNLETQKAEWQILLKEYEMDAVFSIIVN